MSTISHLLKSVVVAVASASMLHAAPAETEQERNGRMQWWRDGKFGMFIHYGLYSGLAGEVDGRKYDGCVEWIQNMAGLDSDSYAAKALPLFKPQRGCAKAWVELARDAGCKYIVLTSKHHEGFALFDSKASEFNSVKATGADIVKEYAEACRANGIKTGYYYSLLDWHHPDYDGKLALSRGISYPSGNLKTHRFGNHDAYKAFLKRQIGELTSNYGAVDLIWWDFSSRGFQGDEAWGASDLLRMVRDKHPQVVMNNRLYDAATVKDHGPMTATAREKGDFTTPEHYIPEKGVRGDWEACMTLNGTWGYSATNNDWKTPEVLVRQLADTVSRGGNFLLNLGPKADGGIPEESVRLFQAIGAWMKINQEAIYGTTASPFAEPFPWGVVTGKGDALYLIMYEMPKDGILKLPYAMQGSPSAQALADGSSVPVRQEEDGTVLDVSKIRMMPCATVVKLAGKGEVLPMRQ